MHNILFSFKTQYSFLISATEDSSLREGHFINNVHHYLTDIYILFQAILFTDLHTNPATLWEFWYTTVGTTFVQLPEGSSNHYRNLFLEGKEVSTQQNNHNLS